MEGISVCFGFIGNFFSSCKTLLVALYFLVKLQERKLREVSHVSELQKEHIFMGMCKQGDFGLTGDEAPQDLWNLPNPLNPPNLGSWTIPRTRHGQGRN